MAHAEKCPVCDKDGEVERELPDGKIISIKCHGCNGLGWVTVYDGNEFITPAFPTTLFDLRQIPNRLDTTATDATQWFGVDTGANTTSTSIANFTIDTDENGNTSWNGTDSAGNWIGINFTSSITRTGTTEGDDITYRFSFSDDDKEKFK